MAIKKNSNPVKDIEYYKKKFWKVFFYSLIGIIVFFLFASWGLFGSMPSFEDLENPDSNLATEVISSDGVTIGKFYNENRTSIKYQDLPKHLVNALVATEDERFYEHSGVDGRGTLRAVASFGTSGGASTLTQQLAKQLFHGEGSKFLPFRIIQKAKEWIIAIRLERQYTKNEIIAMYFNKADFINTAVGIRSAAKVYFGKEPRDLTVSEGAMLVGMLKNPSLFNPIKRLEKVQNRRNVVLGQMVKNNFLSEEAKIQLEKEPIVLDFHPESHKDGIATYFREYLREFMKNWLKENKSKGFKEGLTFLIPLWWKDGHTPGTAFYSCPANLNEPLYTDMPDILPAYSDQYTEEARNFSVRKIIKWESPGDLIAFESFQWHGSCQWGDVTYDRETWSKEFLSIETWREP